MSAILSYLPIQNGLREATSVLGYVIPPQVMTQIEEQLIWITPHRGALLSLGLVTTLWLASIAFKGLILGLDMVHGSDMQRPLWLSALILFTAIQLLYVWGPSKPVSRRVTIPGAAAATIIWLVLAWALGFYFHHFGELKFARFFGFLAAPVAFMTWLYCSATAILVGAEINSRLKRTKTKTASYRRN
jgi:membrane protein